jgi:Peptidase_C39 like family
MPPVATAPGDTVTPAPTVLTVPYRSQLDGSRQAKANCGPACLSMLLSLYGDGTAIGDLRFNINQYMKVWSASNGSSWEALADAAAMRRFRIIGLLKSPGVYRRWSVDDLLAETARGNPVMILTRYKYLPGHENTYVQYNHYVVVVGADAAGSIIYHDPAYLDGASGAYRAMTREQLNAAWSTVSSGIIYSGMAIRPADGK